MVFDADSIKRASRVLRMAPYLITKKGIMETQQNPNEPGKQNVPGQQGGQQQQQDRDRQERERQQREREKQGGGQQGGGQQGGR